MHPFAKVPNLLNRTIQAFLPGTARPDDPFAEQFLTEAEYGLYLKLDARDRTHSVFVARMLLKRHPGAAPEVVAAALLHDAAKALLPFNPLHRIAVHLYRPSGLPRAPLRPGLAGALQLREHHEALGAELIRGAGGREEVARLVAAMGEDAPGGADVRLLKEADSAT